MTKDAQRLLKHIIDEAKSQNSTMVEVDISRIKNIPNIGFAKKKLLNELEAVGVISGYEESVLGDISVYLTSGGLEYFDDLGENRELPNIVLNVSGGQVNIANDNGKIEAVQKTHSENGLEKEVQKEVWMEIIRRWGEYIDIDNWEAWTSYLLGKRNLKQYCYIDNYHQFQMSSRSMY